MQNLIRQLGVPALLLLAGTGLYSAPISSCAADLSSCNVYEGQTLSYPSGFFGYSGDVIVQSPLGTTVDVFRVFNDLIDTGGGTGLGVTAFLYAADLHDLPSPSTYSINAVSILRGTRGPAGFYETDYNGNGTIYRILTPSPEPSTLASLGVGGFVLSLLSNKKRRSAR